MRTIKLTHDQFELLSQCLGIAEKQYSNTQKSIVENLINVRGNVNVPEQGKIAMFYHEIACEIANLNQSLSSGDLDV